MARKLNKPADEQLSAQKHEEQKEFLDPASVSTATATFGWFAFKAALQGLIGFIAVQLFIPVWNFCTKGSFKEKNESDTQVPESESEKES